MKAEVVAMYFPLRLENAVMFFVLVRSFLLLILCTNCLITFCNRVFRVSQKFLVADSVY